MQPSGGPQASNMHTQSRTTLRLDVFSWFFFVKNLGLLQMKAVPHLK